ncbi:hypothetical protein B0H13DRAFT_1910433 [Mycena leptocephala]|nr:hypothetical protein B0H13DRAFT_1910433 [Mycena leptocephala]
MVVPGTNPGVESRDKCSVGTELVEAMRIKEEHTSFPGTENPRPVCLGGDGLARLHEHEPPRKFDGFIGVVVSNRFPGRRSLGNPTPREGSVEQLHRENVYGCIRRIVSNDGATNLLGFVEDRIGWGGRKMCEVWCSIEEVVEPIDGTEDGYEKKLRAELENCKMGSGALGLLGLLISGELDLGVQNIATSTILASVVARTPLEEPRRQPLLSYMNAPWKPSLARPDLVSFLDLQTPPRPGHAPSDSLSNHPSRTPAKVASHVPAALPHPKIAGRAVESNQSNPCFRTLALEMKRLGLKLSDDRDSFKLPVDVESTVEFLKRLEPNASIGEGICRSSHLDPIPGSSLLTTESGTAEDIPRSSPPPASAFLLFTAFLDVLKYCTTLGPQDQAAFLYQQINRLEHYLEESSVDYPLPPSDAFFTHADEQNDEEWVDTRKKIMDETIALGKMRSLLDERQIFDEERRAWKVRAILQDLGELQSDL